MFPDEQDVVSAMQKVTGAVPRPKAEEIWPIVALTREFLQRSREWCWSSGRHRDLPAFELQRAAELFIGKPVSDFVFCAALFLVAPTPTIKPSTRPIDLSKFGHLKIKFPPLGNLEGFQEQWASIQREVETEIAREKEQVAINRILLGQETELDFARLSEEKRIEITDYLQEQETRRRKAGSVEGTS